MAFLIFKIAERKPEFLDFLLRRFDGNIARADELLVSLLRVVELVPVLHQLALNGLQAQRVLAGGVAIARAELSAGAGAQLALLRLQPLDLRDEPLAHAGMGGEPLVVLRDLLPQVLFFHFQQCFGIPPFDTADEEPGKTANKISETSKHNGLFS